MSEPQHERQSQPLPSDYDAEDGFNDETGTDCCPHCERDFSMNGGLQGPCYDQSGQRYTIYLDSDPADAPFFCAECWRELQVNKKQDENHNLGDFA